MREQEVLVPKILVENTIGLVGEEPGEAGMVFISRNGEKFEKCESDEFEDEGKLREMLQKLIKDDPNLLLPPIVKEERPSTIFLTEEFQVGSGSIDLLGVDDEGSIYIVETKLYRNSDRRAALAQAIDYASALWSEYSRNTDGFIEELRKRKESFNLDLDEETIGKIKDNIKEGGLNLVIAMDRVDERTETMINFLNEMCEFDVYALNFERYRASDGTEIVIPKLFPSRQPTVTRPSMRKVEWNEESFFEDAKKKGLSDAQIEVLKRIYKFSKEIAGGEEGIRWGRGEQTGTFGVRVKNLFGELDIYSVGSDGYLTVSFGYMYPSVISEKSKMELVDKFAEQLYNAGIISRKITSENYIERGNQQLRVKPENWMNKVEKFENTVKELIARAGEG